MSNIKYILKAISEISEKEENRGKIPCPKCQGELNYTRASLNGHVWGKCKTEDCLSWMQ